MAVKVTEAPWQTGLAEDATETLTGNPGLTVMSIWFETAGSPVLQVSEDVRTHVTWSLFAGVYAYIQLFAPTLIPLTFH